MNVKAAPGTQCPMEGRPKSYITDSEAVTVPDTAYYRRLVDDGSLVESTPSTPSTESTKSTQREDKQ